MSRSYVPCFHFAALLLAVACHGLLAPTGQAAESAEGTAMTMGAEMIGFAGVPGGIGVVVGAEDASLALALAKQGSFTVQCLFSDDEKCRAARKAIDEIGVYGVVSADTLDSKRLPYTNNLLNLVVIDTWAEQASRGLVVKEILRVLAPLGTAWLRTSSPDEAEKLSTQLKGKAVEGLSRFDGDLRMVRFKRPWPEDID